MDQTEQLIQALQEIENRLRESTRILVDFINQHEDSEEYESIANQWNHAIRESAIIAKNALESCGVKIKNNC